MQDILKHASKHGLTVRLVKKEDYALGLDQLKLFVSRENLNKYGLKFDRAQLLYTQQHFFSINTFNRWFRIPDQTAIIILAGNTPVALGSLITQSPTNQPNIKIASMTSFFISQSYPSSAHLLHILCSTLEQISYSCLGCTDSLLRCWQLDEA